MDGRSLQKEKEFGLTLVELLIATTIMLAVFAMAFTVFIQTRRVSLRNQMDADILQNARVGLDGMVRMIRMIGTQRDREHAQVALIEAAPFQIIFNADIYANQSALCPGMPVKLYDATDYTAPMRYTTGAETIRWTLDTNDDGVVDKYDTNDDEEERLTAWNPNDMVLIHEINGGYDRQVTLNVLGPFDVNDQRTAITPMFQYWLLRPDNTFFLLGDQDGNLRLEGDEQYFRAITSQLLLQQVRRIQITLTTESDGRDPFDTTKHRRVTLSTEVNLRNAE